MKYRCKIWSLVIDQIWPIKIFSLIYWVKTALIQVRRQVVFEQVHFFPDRFCSGGRGLSFMMVSNFKEISLDIFLSADASESLRSEFPVRVEVESADFPCREVFDFISCNLPDFFVGYLIFVSELFN